MFNFRRNFAILFLLSCISFVFYIKQVVQALHKDVALVEQQLAEEKDAIHVLSAEWTYLNSPEVLAKLAKRYLDTKEITIDQIYLFDPEQNLVAQHNVENKDFMKVKLVHPTKVSNTVWNYKRGL